MLRLKELVAKPLWVVVNTLKKSVYQELSPPPIRRRRARIQGNLRVRQPVATHKEEQVLSRTTKETPGGKCTSCGISHASKISPLSACLLIDEDELARTDQALLCF